MSAQRFTVVDGDDNPVDGPADTTRPEREGDLDLDLALAAPGIETTHDGDLAVDLGLESIESDADESSNGDQDGEHDVVSAEPTPPVSHPRISEAVRYLLDRYEMTSATEFPSAIAVVSALRKEGVTTVSQSLAEVLSVDFGYAVCWVDLSWAQGAPTANRGLRRRRDRSRSSRRPAGILDVVGGESELDDVIRTSPDTNVAYVGEGSTAVSLREVTRSIELHDVLDELKSRFDIVVFDSAPVADNSSALSLIQQSDAFVFVTQHGTTTTQHVSDAVRMLEPLPAMGAVLNSYRSRTPRALRRFFPAER